jgi:hypothetical protein
MGEPVLVTCGLCPRDDNQWPASAFTISGTATTKGRARICNACWLERYGHNYQRTCAACGRVKWSRSKAQPYICRDCRDRRTPRTPKHGDGA